MITFESPGDYTAHERETIEAIAKRFDERAQHVRGLEWFAGRCALVRLTEEAYQELVRCGVDPFSVTTTIGPIPGSYRGLQAVVVVGPRRGF